MNKKFFCIAVVPYSYDFKDEKTGKQVTGEGFKHYLIDANGEVSIVKNKEAVIELAQENYATMPKVEVTYKSFTNARGNQELTPQAITLIAR